MHVLSNGFEWNCMTLMHWGWNCSSDGLPRGYVGCNSNKLHMIRLAPSTLDGDIKCVSGLVEMKQHDFVWNCIFQPEMVCLGLLRYVHVFSRYTETVFDTATAKALYLGYTWIHPCPATSYAILRSTHIYIYICIYMYTNKQINKSIHE